MSLWTSFKASGIPGLYFAFVFLLSGIVINVLQLITLITLWPISVPLYRLANNYLILFYWSELIWCAEWWAGIKIKLFGDEKELKSTVGIDKGIALCNHRSDVDWLLGLCIAEKYGCLGGAKAYMKGNTKFLPIIGWAWWFLEFVFLSRNWESDQSKLNAACASLKGFPVPFWMVIFAEGTRFTEDKLKVSQEFARKSNIHVPEHTLVPKTKGFAFTAIGLRDVVSKVYDVTFAFPEGKEPSIGTMIQGKPGEVHILIKSYDIQSLPKEEKELQQWCRELYIKKDKALAYHKTHQRYQEDFWEIPPHTFPLVVMTGWCLSLFAAIVYSVYSAVRAGETTTLLFILGVFVVLGGIVKFLVNFSKANKKKKKSE